MVKAKKSGSDSPPKPADNKSPKQLNLEQSLKKEVKNGVADTKKVTKKFTKGSKSSSSSTSAFIGKFLVTSSIFVVVVSFGIYLLLGNGQDGENRFSKLTEYSYLDLFDHSVKTLFGDGGVTQEKEYEVEHPSTRDEVQTQDDQSETHKVESESDNMDNLKSVDETIENELLEPTEEEQRSSENVDYENADEEEFEKQDMLEKSSDSENETSKKSEESSIIENDFDSEIKEEIKETTSEKESYKVEAEAKFETGGEENESKHSEPKTLENKLVEDNEIMEKIGDIKASEYYKLIGDTGMDDYEETIKLNQFLHRRYKNMEGVDDDVLEGPFEYGVDEEDEQKEVAQGDESPEKQSEDEFNSKTEVESESQSETESKEEFREKIESDTNADSEMTKTEVVSEDEIKTNENKQKEKLVDLEEVEIELKSDYVISDKTKDPALEQDHDEEEVKEEEQNDGDESLKKQSEDEYDVQSDEEEFELKGNDATFDPNEDSASEQSANEDERQVKLKVEIIDDEIKYEHDKVVQDEYEKDDKVDKNDDLDEVEEELNHVKEEKYNEEDDREMIQEQQQPLQDLEESQEDTLEVSDLGRSDEELGQDEYGVLDQDEDEELDEEQLLVDYLEEQQNGTNDASKLVQREESLDEQENDEYIDLSDATEDSASQKSANEDEGQVMLNLEEKDDESMHERDEKVQDEYETETKADDASNEFHQQVNRDKFNDKSEKIEIKEEENIHVDVEKDHNEEIENETKDAKLEEAGVQDELEDDLLPNREENKSQENLENENMGQEDIDEDVQLEDHETSENDELGEVEEELNHVKEEKYNEDEDEEMIQEQQQPLEDLEEPLDVKKLNQDEYGVLDQDEDEELDEEQLPGEYVEGSQKETSDASSLSQREDSLGRDEQKNDESIDISDGKIEKEIDLKIDETLNEIEKEIAINARQAVNKYHDKLMKNINDNLAALGKARALTGVWEEEGIQSILEDAQDTYFLLLGQTPLSRRFSYIATADCIKLLEVIKGADHESLIKETLQSLIDMYPNDLDEFNDLALISLKEGRHKTAKIAFQLMLERDPLNTLARLYLGFLLKIVDQDFQTAVDLMLPVVVKGDTNVGDPEIFLELADALNRLGRKEEAKHVYTQAVDTGLLQSFWQHSISTVPGLVNRVWWTKDQLSEQNQRLLSELENYWFNIREEVTKVMEDEHMNLLQQVDDSLEVESGGVERILLFDHGTKITATCNRLPATCRWIQNIPDVAKCQQCQAQIYIIQPNTRLASYISPTNARIKADLGLSLARDDLIVVRGEQKSWKLGQFVLYDPSFDREWIVEENENDEDDKGESSNQINSISLSGNRRAILSLELWHPELSDEQKESLNDF